MWYKQIILCVELYIFNSHCQKKAEEEPTLLEGALCLVFEWGGASLVNALGHYIGFKGCANDGPFVCSLVR